jgi:hypothetical protein
MDTQCLFEEDSIRPDAICNIRQAETRAREQTGAVGIAENAVAQAQPLTFRSLGFITMDEAGEIESELVMFSLGVWALHLAELALKARVHDAGRLACGNAANIAVVFLVQQRKQSGEAVAVFEAEPAALTDLERADDLFVESAGIPVFSFGRIVREPIRGLIGDVLGLFHFR